MRQFVHRGRFGLLLAVLIATALARVVSQQQPPPPREDRSDDRNDPWSQPPADPSTTTYTQHHTTQQQTTNVSPALAQAQQVCATYKSTKLDPTKVPSLPRSVAGQSPIGETSNWDAGLNAARCVIVRDNRTGNVTVTITSGTTPTFS